MGMLSSAIYWFGPVLGIAVGLLGGAIGTWMTIRKAPGPYQRREAIRFSVLIWVIIAILMTGLSLLPSPWRHLLWVPYCLALPLLILWGHHRFQAAGQADRS
jgi:hypothetical protein